MFNFFIYNSKKLKWVQFALDAVHEDKGDSIAYIFSDVVGELETSNILGIKLSHTKLILCLINCRELVTMRPNPVMNLLRCKHRLVKGDRLYTVFIMTRHYIFLEIIF